MRECSARSGEVMPGGLTDRFRWINRTGDHPGSALPRRQGERRPAGKFCVLRACSSAVEQPAHNW